MTDKLSMLERLNRREAQRIEKLHKAHKSRDNEALDENEDYFSATFKIKLEVIEDLIAKVPSLETESLPTHFISIKREVNELQKYVVSSAIFLKDFYIKKHMGIVQNLQSKCQELEEHYIPRKKFGFTRKKLATSEPKPQSVDEQDTAGNESSCKWNEKLFGFDSRENEVLTLTDDEIYQRDITLRNLKRCTIILKGVMGTLHMSNIFNCVILSGPVQSSVFVENCTNSKLIVACQQLRMHSSSKCDIYLHVTSKGIVEDCIDIRTAPYNLNYEDLDIHFKLSSLDRQINNWEKLDDFNWLAPDVPSPNWSVMQTEDRVTHWSEYFTELPAQ